MVPSCIGMAGNGMIILNFNIREALVVVTRDTKFF